MSLFSEQLADFLEDAESAGYTLVLSEPLEKTEQAARAGRTRTRLVLTRGRPVAWIWLWFDEKKWRFGKAEPVGGAKELEDSWSMKRVREKFRIPART